MLLLSYCVQPTASNPNFGAYPGGNAWLLVATDDCSRAEQRARTYLEDEAWKIVGMTRSPAAPTPAVDRAGQRRQKILARQAADLGLGCVLEPPPPTLSPRTKGPGLFPAE